MKLSFLPKSTLLVNCKERYQRCPVCIQISNFERWHKLGTSDDQKVEIEEELELLVENLREKHNTTVKRLDDLSVEQETLKEMLLFIQKHGIKDILMLH